MTLRLDLDNDISDSVDKKLRSGDDAILVSGNENMANIELDNVIKTES